MSLYVSLHHHAQRTLPNSRKPQGSSQYCGRGIGPEGERTVLFQGGWHHQKCSGGQEQGLLHSAKEYEPQENKPRRNCQFCCSGVFYLSRKIPNPFPQIRLLPVFRLLILSPWKATASTPASLGKILFETCQKSRMLLATEERALGSLLLGSDISDCDMSGLHQLLGLNPQSHSHTWVPSTAVECIASNPLA